jgi:hypothetical protein
LASKGFSDKLEKNIKFHFNDDESKIDYLRNIGSQDW